VRGERVVRVIHGKGEGRLREALHRVLISHPLVDRYRESSGGGATVILLVER
jgi:dsDNA-specific endonuclease/ATPase MutS2